MTRQYVNGSFTTELTRGKPYFSAGLRVAQSCRLYHCPSYDSSEIVHDSSILTELSTSGVPGLAKEVGVRTQGQRV